MLKRIVCCHFSALKASMCLDAGALDKSLVCHATRGNTFITALIFLFVLIGTLRLCNVKTLHETKLTKIFVQETQGFYLLENLMHLGRDYMYQIVQNPCEPHIFLNLNPFLTKDKLGLKDVEEAKDKWAFDINGSLSEQQIVPADFPLKLRSDIPMRDRWEIRGGPILWQDNKKDAYDKRHLAEVFMMGKICIDSKFVPDWIMHTVQTMEIERNPLCDFQLYAEGDTTINTNIMDSPWKIDVDGPVQINGNARFSSSNGDADNFIDFHNKFNSAGYALYLDGSSSLANYKLPEKYHMLDNTENNQKTYGSGTDTYKIKPYAINYDSTSTTEIPYYHNNFEDNSYDSYEKAMFNTYHGNFTTRSRVYRPIGFDPGNYWGFWESSSAIQPAVSSGAGEVVSQNEQVLNFWLGFHALVQTSSNWGRDAFDTHFYRRTGADNYSTQYALQQLRGLGTQYQYQMVEKARLVEMQKPMNHPCVYLSVVPDNNQKNSSTLYVPNNFIYSTYLINGFPATKDNIYLNRYFNLAFQNSSLLSITACAYRVTDTSDISYGLDYIDLPGPILTQNIYFDIVDHRNILYRVIESASIDNTFATLRSTFAPTGHGDDACPPHKIIDQGSYWYLDNYVTRITGEHYNFMYDRNRAKWIQLVDIDIGKFKTAVESIGAWNDGSVMPILCINTYWQGAENTMANKNYRKDGVDIRYNYATRRGEFFNNYANGSYVYPNDGHPVIDIGVRLINARTLPDKGLTIYCPYPLYIKGNFNDVSQKPALIMTDSLTLLPDSWQDWRSQTDCMNSYLWYGRDFYNREDLTMGYRCLPLTAGTTIYADIITGRTHPHFWIKTADTNTGEHQTLAPNPDMGFHDAFRSLCNFNERIEFHGSLMLPYFCQEQWEPPIDFCKKETHDVQRDPYVYAYPNIDWSPRKNVGVPAAMPVYYRINRGRKTHCIGREAYLSLLAFIMTNDYYTNSFSQYHSDLPNYLKYEVAP